MTNGMTEQDNGDEQLEQWLNDESQTKGKMA